MIDCYIAMETNRSHLQFTLRVFNLNLQHGNNLSLSPSPTHIAQGFDDTLNEFL